ncbi:hypothetical protein CsSME_00007780 [Camellia sinensis var. sinensis]
MLSSTEHPRVITCKAAVAWGAGEALVMEEVEVSPPHPMEIRIKVVCTSLCRSDVTAWQSQVLSLFHQSVLLNKFHASFIPLSAHTCYVEGSYMFVPYASYSQMP